MRFRLSFARRAGRQIRTAAKWWVANRTAAPAMLTEELEAALAFIRNLPFAGEVVPHPRLANLRRVLLERTQYHLYYTVDAEQGIVEVIALWHTSRGIRPRL